MGISIIEPWARTHHGVITRTRALELGWTGADWRRAMRRDEIVPLHRGVARLIGAPPTPEQRIHAAVMAVGRTAMASHRSSARLWGVERPVDDPVDVIVDRSVTRLHLDGVVIHRPRDRVDARHSMRAVTPCTNLLRTLVDLGAVVGSVDAAVSSAIVSGAVTPAVLHRLVERHALPGRHGVGALRRALRAWPLAGKPADSELEIRMARLLRDHRLPPATFHAHVAGYEVDFLIDGTRIVLECVGWQFHGRTRQQFERDTERTAALTAAGYVVCNFTWRQVTREASATARRIRSLLAQWAPDLLASAR